MTTAHIILHRQDRQGDVVLPEPDRQRCNRRRNELRRQGSAATRRGERTFAWLNQFCRLRVRYDKRADIHEASFSLGCALICWQSLRKTWRTA